MFFSSECKERFLATLSDIGQVVKHVTCATELDDSTEAHENFALSLFLIVGIVRAKLSLPINVVRRQSPDFLLTHGDKQETIGLEHTTGTTEKYKMDEKIFDEYPEGSLLELPEYSPRRQLPKKSRIAMRRPGEKLQSPGWGDYEMEKDWTEVMSNAIEKKTRTLNKEHYARFRNNELIVEDTSHVSSQKRLPKSISMLRENRFCETVGRLAVFDKVHIVTEGILIYDVFGEALETSIRKDPLRKMWQRRTRQS